MDISTVNSCMRYFIDLVIQFLDSSFGFYFMGCLVSIFAFDILLRIVRIDYKS